MRGRILIAGTGSGSGKTTFTCAILAALKAQGLRVSACKCGPDYIDPMFHREVLGVPSRNLDSFLCGRGAVRELLGESYREGDITVIEGVMGFYDGVATTPEHSSWQLARDTGTPVLLVADCRGKSLSLAVEIQGFQGFLPGGVAGVLLNRASPKTYPALRDAIRERCGLPVLGYLPALPEAALESRHLGLVTAPEIAGLREKIKLLGDTAAQTVDLEGLRRVAETAPAIEAGKPEGSAPSFPNLRIAVARDRAFCFWYPDSLAVLEGMGAGIAPFSPLEDRALPENIHGLYLCGGYPELYGQQIAENRELLEQIHRLVAGGLPTVAECGGFALLCRSLETSRGVFPMAGVIDAKVRMTKGLSRFGYVTLTAREDNLLCGKGERLSAHEFHYSQADEPGDGFAATKANGDAWECVHIGQTLYAGYPHIHFKGNEGAAARFLRRCAERRGDGK